MLLRIRVNIYNASDIKAIEKAILSAELAQNVTLGSDLVGDFVNVDGDGGTFLLRVWCLKQTFGCNVLVELG